MYKNRISKCKNIFKKLLTNKNTFDIISTESEVRKMTKREAKEILTDAVMNGYVSVDAVGIIDDNSLNRIKEALLMAIVSLTDNE